LCVLSEDERRRLEENGRRFVIKNHDYAVLAPRFLEAVRGGDAMRSGQRAAASFAEGDRQSEQAHSRTRV
jgi:spore maturation protein CgeB